MSSWGRMRKLGEKIEKEKEKERKKGRKGDPAPTGLQCSNNKNFDGSRSDLVCAPRGRGSLLLWLFSI